MAEVKDHIGNKSAGLVCRIVVFFFKKIRNDSMLCIRNNIQFDSYLIVKSTNKAQGNTEKNRYSFTSVCLPFFSLYFFTCFKQTKERSREGFGIDEWLSLLH